MKKMRAHQYVNPICLLTVMLVWSFGGYLALLFRNEVMAQLAHSKLQDQGCLSIHTFPNEYQSSFTSTYVPH
jgi:hypothetical protein